jgi:tetratricopeptide (TPR) repeat protein
MRRAFVSHSTRDDSYVAEMESFLRAAGFDEVFDDVSAISPDERFWPRIEKGLAESDTLVVVITAASNTSDWVKREVEYARSLSKKIIPLWIEDCPLPPTFADRDVIDLRPRIRAERRFDIARIVEYAPSELIGREDETKLLNDAWQKVLRVEKGGPHVLTFVALGGEGKTSLVAKWAAELAHQDWPGCDAAFAWSFYSQGTREQMSASSDLFLKEALTFFGDDADKEFAASNAGAFEKGQRLARIVGQRRSLLILDGLEPLQYAPTSPTSPTPGQLKDQGIAALLKGLAAASHGLCVVTTRYSLPDLRAFWQTSAPEVKLLRLSRAAGVHLIQSFGVKGSLLRNIPFRDGREQVNEFEKLVEDVQGHALTLNLLGTYLRDAHAGDIRKHDLVKLGEADAEEQGGHAFRVMEAYEREFEREGDKGQRALAVLRLLGLFDRPLTSDCLGALLQAPAIPELTEPLVDLTQAQRNLAFKRLEDARLVTMNRGASGALDTLDAHPLLREYFATRVKRGGFWPWILRKLLHRVFPRMGIASPTWRAAHRRLYEYLCANTSEGDQPTLEDLEALYQAVAHGCQAGLQREANAKVFYARIRHGAEAYSLKKLAAFGSDLGGIASFFESRWSRVSSEISQANQAWYLNEAAFCLRALGRLAEALEPMRNGAAMAKGAAEKATDGLTRLHQSKEAAIRASNLSELELTLGELAGAVEDAEQSVTYADRSRNAGMRLIMRATHADALHQAGRRAESERRLREAEQIQAECQPDYPLLYSLRGFQYCDLLLAASERAAWQLVVAGVWDPGRLEFRKLQALSLSAAPTTLDGNTDHSKTGVADPGYNETCRAVYERATKTLKYYQHGNWASVLEIALDHLTLVRAALYAAILKGSEFRLTTSNPSHIAPAVAALRRAGVQEMLPRGLMTRAWLRFLTGARIGSESAQDDLDEAWEIAERGPMRLHMADIHLHRARLFFCEAQYPWESPQADLAAAEKLINNCGYHRRDEELAHAKAAILSR